MEEITKESVSDFYDDFIKTQEKLGVFVRHRIIFKNLKKLGLKPDSSVLEVGCGIGTVSGLITAYNKKGLFLGCDISPKSVEYASRKLGTDRIKFIVSDMSDFSSDIKFDFVVFPDVLEHIPVEQHFKLFENISKVCKPATKVLINIPEPNVTEWMRINRPEALQIIDQSLSMKDLMNNTYPHGFQVQSIIPYSIYTNVPNYVSIVLVRDSTVKSVDMKGKFSKLYQHLRTKFF